MADQPDDSYVDLRAPLENLFAMVEERLDEVRGDPSQERQPYDGVLDVVDRYVKGPLMAEAANAGRATLAAWHLAHVARMIVGEGIQEQGSGSGRYKNLRVSRRELDSALTAVSERHDKDVGARLGELEYLTQQQPQLVADAVEASLAKQGCPCAAELHKLEDDLQGLPPQVAGQITPDLTALQGAVQQVSLALQSLPNALAQAVLAVVDPGGISAGDRAALEAVATTPVNAHTKSADDRINFLTDVLALFRKVGKVPADLVTPISGVIVGVLGFDDPQQPLTPAQLDKLTELNRKLARFL